MLTSRLSTSVITSFIFILVLFQNQVFGANLVVNGDFQDGNSGFSSDYLYTPDANSNGNPVLDAGQYAIDSRAYNVHGAWVANFDHTHGDASGLYLIANGSTDPTDVVWQMSAPVPVVTGEIYRFEAYLMDLLTSANDQPVLQFQLGDGTNWKNLGSSPSPFPHAQWTHVYIDGTFNTAGSYYIRLVNTQSAGGGNDLGVDDIFFNLRTEAPSKDSVPGNPSPPSFDTSTLNSAPVITSGNGGDTTATSVLENTTRVTTVSADDANGDTLTFSISGGEDSAKFSIDGSTGALEFLAAPDFDTPTDAGLNNTYIVEVSVADSDGVGDSQLITVTILPSALLMIEQKITAQVPVSTVDDEFGNAVAISGDTAIVGITDGDGAAGNSGAAYVFTRTGTGWTQQAKLTASDGAVGDRFGNAVALSGDTAIIGAYYDGTQSGAAYVFVRSGASWSQQFKLTASDMAAYDEFGTSLAVEGDTAVVSSRGDETYKGSAYVFVRSGTSWSQQAKMTAPNAADYDEFGISVALSGDTVVVGARFDDIDAIGDQGSAYVFVRTGSSWSQQGWLTASDGAAGDKFGHSVAVSGDTLVVGADSGDGLVVNSGAAYVFTRSVSTWSQQAKLTASDGANLDEFGYSLGISGDHIVVGARHDDDDDGDYSGSAYVYSGSGSSWTQAVKLTAGAGAIWNRFGYSVAISGNSVLVGAEPYDVHSELSGSAYVFNVNDYDQWNQQTRLLPVQPDSAATDDFGRSVAISGDTAIIGAWLDDDKGVNSGSAYVFVRSGNSWALQAKLLADDGTVNDIFGISVALYGDTAVVGAANYNSYQGAAYVFTRSGSVWTQQAKLTASDGAGGDYFGSSVAVTGDTVLVGAPSDDSNKGSVYVFVKPLAGWTDPAGNPNYDAKLTASDGSGGDKFGFSAAAAGGTVLVGALGDDSSKGSAYVFTGSGSSWTQAPKLTASDGLASDQFGSGVSISGDTIAVGAVFGDGIVADSGAAYIFTRSDSIWTQQAKLTASDGSLYDEFGFSLAVSGNAVMVGARHDDDVALTSGSAYVFTGSGSSWTQAVKLTASDGAEDDRFGVSVALSGDSALVGADHDPYGTPGEGAAYFYTFPCSFGHEIEVGQWSMIAAPCSPATPGTVATAFGDDLAGFGQDWWLYERNAAAKTYIPLISGDPIDPGVGMWFFSSTAGTLNLGDGTSTPVLGSPDCPSDNGCFVIDLVTPDNADPEGNARGNLIGHPLSYDVDVAELVILVDGVAYDIADTAYADYVLKTLYWWNGNAYESFDDNTPGMSGQLEAFKAFWIGVKPNASGKDVKLLIPTQPSIKTSQHRDDLPWYARLIDWLVPSAQAEPGKSQSHRQAHIKVNQPGKGNEQTEWYIRLTVEQPTLGLKDSANVFGQLADSIDFYDPHDLDELPPAFEPFLTVVFPHPDWGPESADYTSDFHDLPKNKSEGDAWVFEVRSDDPGRMLILSWQGPAGILGRSVLIDAETGEEVTADSRRYEFYMNGQSRRFEWILAKAAGGTKGGKD